MPDTLKILRLDFPYRAANTEPIRAALAGSVWDAVGENETLTREKAARFDAAVVSDEFGAELAIRVRTAAQVIPVLHVLDGIVEWRNVWENPRSKPPGMPMFQPVLSHKIACLGRSQARLLESWGNQGRCEVVGAPRLDGFIGRRPRTRMPGAPAIVLVATAQTPGFTERQVAAVVAALTDVRRAVAARDPSSVRTRWRVAKVIEAQMELFPEECDLPGTPLADSLAHADAVISTPSTLLLEAMLTGLPTALLDYTNSPQYVPAAWSITSAEHVQEALDGLLYPPPERRLLQDFLLHDSLECRTPAAPRAAELLRRMVELGRQARAEEIPLAFPARMLVETLEWHLAGSHDLKALFPGHAVFAESDTARLQAELGHVRTRNLELAAEVERLRKRYELLALMKRAVSWLR